MMTENGDTYTDKNSVSHQQTDSVRHDYVLTGYNPSKVSSPFEFKNTIKATVTPEDGIDSATEASSSAKYSWDASKSVHPTGSFYGRKYGNSNWAEGFRKDWDYASYELNKMQDGSISGIDKFKYFISTYGWPTPWTRDGDADDASSYGKKKVTYYLTDDTLYLDENITSTKKGEDLTYNVPSDAVRLTSKDYQYLYADWSLYSQFKKFDPSTGDYESTSDTYTSEDIVHFCVKTGDSKDYKEVATYNIGTGKSAITNSDTVESLTEKRITFKESANVTGIRFATSNTYYYTQIIAYPMIRLKNSNYVMNKIKGKSVIKLQNFSDSDVYDSDGNTLLALQNYAFDRAVGEQKTSEIHKHIISTGNSTSSRSYTLTWKITEKETIKTDDSTSYIAQNSGTFYDLLPKGTHLKKGSISVETEKGTLSSNSFEYSVNFSRLKSRA